MSSEHLKELLKGYRQGNLDEEGVRELEGYISSGTHDEQIQHDIREALEELSLHALWTKEYSEEIWNRVKNQTIDAPLVIRPVHRIHFLKTAWFKYAAAILLILTGTITYYFFSTSQSQVEVAQTTPSPLPKEDILPGSEKAILTLSTGQQVQLNNATSETIKDGTLSIKNINGQLSYTSAGLPIPSTGGGSERSETSARSARSAGVGHNTMSTPRGGQYKLTLSDGTKVWLNAASSITYPIAFTSKTREVSITGEAYFEVSKNKEKPFIVKTVKEEITVLGTAFNVNTYEDEPAVKVSLLEGSVKVGDTNIKPGQAYQDGKVKQADVQQDIAWKNGVFNFDNLTAEAALRQLARWYDVDIVYESKLPKKTLGGRMGRGLTLQQALKGLDGVIARFRLEGRKLHVSPL